MLVLSSTTGEKTPIGVNMSPPRTTISGEPICVKVRPEIAVPPMLVTGAMLSKSIAMEGVPAAVLKPARSVA